MGAGVGPIDTLGWLRVTGSDRVRWLNGMVTNSIQELKPEEGNYSFLLNAQGRIEGDLTAFLLNDAILLETGDPGRIATLLDHFIIMDDVELEVLASDRAGLALVGPEATKMLARVGLPSPDPIRLTQTDSNGDSLQVVAAHSPLVPRYEIWAHPVALERLTHLLLDAGALRVSADALEQLRILEGTPLYGVDIRNTEAAKDLPQETNQARALHFNKGCYLGQEIVERIRSRGQVHRTFSGFRLDGELPRPGTKLLSDPENTPVGELTSVVLLDHPTAGRMQLGLGYLRREALERGRPLRYSGGSATPVPMPYSPA